PPPPHISPLPLPDALPIWLRDASELPTTSQPTPADFLGAYSELAQYERIYSLHISAKLSGTFQSARTAASELGDRVRVVDTETRSEEHTSELQPLTHLVCP